MRCHPIHLLEHGPTVGCLPDMVQHLNTSDQRYAEISVIKSQCCQNSRRKKWHFWAVKFSGTSCVSVVCVKF